MFDVSGLTLEIAPSDAALADTHSCTTERSAESLRFEHMRNEVCSSQPFLPLTDLFSPRFAEFLPTLCIIEPLIHEMRLPVSTTGSSLMEILGEVPNNDMLNMTGESRRLQSYRSCMEMIERPCAVWERMVANLMSGTSVDFEITGFPVIDRIRNRRAIAFFVRYVTHPAEIVSNLARVVQATEGTWIDLGHGVPDESPIEFL